MSAQKKTIVTGGAGFIGSHLVEWLQERGDEPPGPQGHEAAGHDTRRGPSKALDEHQPHQVGGLRPEGPADPELEFALSHTERDG